MLTLTPGEFLAGIARITSFEELGLPNYTEVQWKTLPPLTRISETLRLRNLRETLDSKVSDHDWDNELAWDTKHTKRFDALRGLQEKGYTFREYLEQVWVAEFGERGFEEYIAHAGSVRFREPYFTNNFEPNLRNAWSGGKRLLSSTKGPKLTALLKDFKKKTRWKVLPKITANPWETDRAFYPLCVFLKREGLNLAR